MNDQVAVAAALKAILVLHITGIASNCLSQVLWSISKETYPIDHQENPNYF